MFNTELCQRKIGVKAQHLFHLFDGIHFQVVLWRGQKEGGRNKNAVAREGINAAPVAGAGQHELAIKVVGISASERKPGPAAQLVGFPFDKKLRSGAFEDIILWGGFAGQL